MARNLFAKLPPGLVADRLVLMRLCDVHRGARDDDDLLGATRAGLAGFFGCAAPSMSTYLKRLVSDGMATRVERRFAGQWRSVDLFAPTRDGVEEAARADAKARRAKVKSGGKEIEIRALLERLPVRATVADIVRHLDNGVFDAEGFSRARSAGVPGREFPAAVRFPRNFVGRARERRQVVEFLANRQLSVLVVDGLPGIGKTTLVSACLREWLRGEAPIWYDFASGSRSEELVEALAAAMLDRGRPALDRCLRSATRLRRPELMSLVRRELTGFPVTVAFDNVQFASDDAREAVREVANAAGQRHQLKLFLVCRDRQGIFDIALAAGSDRVQQLMVGPLDFPDADALWRRLGGKGELSSAAAGALGGNPHLVTLAAAGGLGDPIRLIDLLEKELVSRLDPGERDTIESLAVVRGAAQLELLDAVGLRSHEALRRLTARFLVRQEGYGTYSLHDTVREAALRSMTKPRREGLDARAAEHYCLVGGTRGLSEAAFHLGRLGDAGRIGNFLLRYGTRLLHGGYISSIESLLDTAFSALTPDRADLAELHLLHGRVRSARGGLAAAAESFAAAEAVPGVRAWALVRARAEGAASLLRLGRMEEATRKLAQVQFQPGSLGYEVPAYEEAGVRFLMGTTLEGLDHLDLAVEQYRACASIEAMNSGPLAELGLARVLWKKGYYEEAEAGFARAHGLAVAADERETAVNALIWRGSTLERLADGRQGAIEEAIAATKAAIGEADESGLLWLRAVGLNALASHLWYAVDVEGAMAHAEEALSLFSEFADVGMTANTMATLANLKAAKGDRQGAIGIAEEILKLPQDNIPADKQVMLLVAAAVVMRDCREQDRWDSILSQALTLAKSKGLDRQVEDIMKWLEEGRR